MADKGTNLKFKTTADIAVSKTLVDQVIGQEDAVNIVKKAAQQRRHVMLIGEPGTGKSMLGLALAELLSKEKLVDVIAFPNPHDENQPKIQTFPAGKGREIVTKAKMSSQVSFKNQNILIFVIVLIATFLPYYFWRKGEISDIIFAASMVTGMVFIVGFMMFLNLNKKMGQKALVPKVIVDNFGRKTAPFFDVTGSHAGALLGDVLHDPFQSGGLGTPAHERVIAGMIHKTHKGVLFIDEISTLKPATQQELVTALQEKKYAITGQSERSAGAMVRTEPAPCDFVMEQVQYGP